ncbi:MAG: class I SAM-dependent methyltransferase [Magnetovibrio sp.]|nr:class I SAM-dependent methyltransferase [Magnetovibrio sp.]
MAAVAKKKSEGLLGKITSPFRKKNAKPTAKKAAPEPVEKPKKPQEKLYWPPSRLNVIEKLWGQGYTTPGGADRVKQFAPLLQLDEKKSLLLLGAGLGGINETLVEDTGVWVTGIEPDQELAKMGHESMQRAGHKRKAPIRYNDMEELKLKPKSFDAMLALDQIHTVKDKKALFNAVTEALRLHGEMLFISFSLPDTNPPNEILQSWINQQDKTPYLWPIEAMLAMLNTLDLDVRPPDDMTREYRNCVLKAWVNFLSNMNKAELKEMAADVVGECARWAELITAIDRGGLKVMKYNCVKVQEKRKSVDELMAQA